MKEYSETKDGSNTDNIEAVLDEDDGYLLGGNIGAHDDSNHLVDGKLWLAKTDAHGQRTWEKTYTGAEGESLSFEGLARGIDGGFVLVGDGDKESYLIKTDHEGAEQWRHGIEKTDEYNPERYLDVVALDDGYVAVGTVPTEYEAQSGDHRQGYSGAEDGAVPPESLMLVQKLDEDGDPVWDWTGGYRTSSRRKDTYSAQKVVVSSDGGFAVAGQSYRADYESYHLLGFSANGKRQWNADIETWDLNELKQLSNGDYVTFGYQGKREQSVVFSRVGEDGDVKWTRSYAKPEETSEGWTAHQLTTGFETDDGFVLFGYNTNYGGDQDGNTLIRTSQSGELRSFERWSESDHALNDVVGLDDDEYVGCGNTFLAGITLGSAEDDQGENGGNPGGDGSSENGDSGNDNGGNDDNSGNRDEDNSDSEGGKSGSSGSDSEKPGNGETGDSDRSGNNGASGDTGSDENGC